jgi:hypothetical protein
MSSVHHICNQISMKQDLQDVEIKQEGTEQWYHYPAE